MKRSTLRLYKYERSTQKSHGQVISGLLRIGNKIRFLWRGFACACPGPNMEDKEIITHF